MSIQERQNRPNSIALLLAGGFLYRRAKRARNLRLSIVIVVGIVGIIASVTVYPFLSQWFSIFILTTWLLDQHFVRVLEEKNRTEAAQIQERFDCEVLGIPWPYHKGIQPPTSDRVRQLSVVERANVDQRDLHDWYSPESIPSDPILAQIFCQRMNCWWDVNLRRKWRACVTVILLLFGGLLVLLAVATNMTVAKLVAIIAAVIRVLAWGLGELQDQADAIRRVEGIHTFLSQFSLNNRPVSAEVRNVQDAILDHRCSNRPVPDWFYRWHRRNQQREAREPTPL